MLVIVSNNFPRISARARAAARNRVGGLDDYRLNCFIRIVLVMAFHRGDDARVGAEFLQNAHADFDCVPATS